ncbi:MAG: DinB family protein [Ignavibacteria bacterium]|nr:MAG: DinB family protein [Ignavibacteria bacterium]KAF0161658.1 MAG: DinB family protein [Ignavibacteria bacterium]
MNPVINKLIIELNKVIEGDPWFGAPLKSILEGINCQQAVMRINTNAHSIAEIALHILAWVEETASRLEGNEPKEPKRGDWQSIDTLDKVEWENIVNKIFEMHKRIEELVASFSLEKLEEQVGSERNPALGTGFSFREMLVGLMEHNVYHGGQIALLKKLI